MPTENLLYWCVDGRHKIPQVLPWRIDSSLPGTVQTKQTDEEFNLLKCFKYSYQNKQWQNIIKNKTKVVAQTPEH